MAVSLPFALADGSSKAHLYLWRCALIVGSYVLIAYPLNHLERSPYLIGPVGLHMGFAMAALLCWGRSLWPGVLVGYASLVLISTERIGWSGLGVALLLTIGHLMTVLAAAWLVRRWMPPGPLLLLDLPEALRFLGLSTGLATLACPSWGTLVFHLAFELPRSECLGVWIDWWLSDCGGALVSLPIALCLIAEPRTIWRPRLFNVGLLSLLATLLLVLVLHVMSRWDTQRQVMGFERSAMASGIAIQNRLDNALAVLDASRALLAFDQANAEAHRALGRSLGQAHLIDLIGHADIDPARRAGPMPMPVQAAQALAGPAFPPGQDLLAIPALKPAVSQALLDGKAHAGSGFRLLDEPADAPLRVMIVQVVKAAPQRLAFVSLRPQAMVDAVSSQQGGQVKACISDPASAQLLAGEPGCERSIKFLPDLRRTLHLAGADWHLRVYSDAARPLSASLEGKVIEAFGIGCLALITALLLTHSGATHRASSLAVQRAAELHQTSQALHSEEQRFRGVFEHAPVGVCISGLDGRPLDANPEFCRMLDCTPQTLPQRYQAHVAEDATLACRLARQGEASLRLQRSFPHADGSAVQADLLMNLLRDEAGQPSALLCVAQDITQRLLLAEHERARQAAELASQAKSDFLSRMSHELRTPLNGLLGFTQLLQLEREPLSSTQRAWVERIGTAGWHLLAMINDVLDLARVEAGELHVVLAPQDLHALAQECLTLLGPLASRFQVSTGATLEPGARYAMADATRVREIFHNLLSNGIKYNLPGGSVHLQLHAPEPGWVEVRVSDDGPGLSPQQLAALYQPFNRLGQERSGIEGTGIGLVIARHLAERMQGSLTATSQPGRGSTFTLRLPAAAAPPTPAQATPHAAQRAPRQLVYIEDNPTNIALMRALVSLYADLSLTVHTEGRSGLAAVLAAPPDLLLLDIRLPDISGLEVLRRLRQSPQGAELPVLVISADALQEDVEAGIAAGAAHVLTKPYAVADLMAAIEGLLNRPQAQGSGR